MASIWIDLFVTLGPVFLFIILMFVVWYRGSRQNKALLVLLESDITKGLSQRGIEYEKVKIKDNEYEYRCHVKGNTIRVLTLHLKMVNRAFAVQWLINFIFKEKEKLFMGAKFSGTHGDEDPVYRLDVVPYRNKSYISRRFEEFVDFDDIPTSDPQVDKKYMIKSTSASYVTHLVENKDIVKLLAKFENTVEHISLKNAREPTDPHISITYAFPGLENPPIMDYIRLFFLITDSHLKNHNQIKKLVAKGSKGRYATNRGTAKRGGARKTKKKRTSKSN